jgi:PAS domain-containing protein
MIEVFRKEIKYSISTVSFYKVRPLFEACMQLDPYCTNGAGYQVRSLYFDSACDGDLFDVLDGLLSKQKVRLRCYSPESETMKLEYKCKTGTDSQKKSLTVSRQDAKRMMAGCYEFLRDIPDPVSTELYGAEQDLRRGEERYRRFLETANEGIWIVDTGWKTVYVNHQMCTMLGCSEPEMRGRSPLDFVSPEFHKTAAQSFQRRRQGVSERFEQAYRRIYAPPLETWDDTWELVVADGVRARRRQALRDLLRWEGYGTFAPGVYARPAQPSGAL